MYRFYHRNVMYEAYIWVTNTACLPCSKLPPKPAQLSLAQLLSTPSAILVTPLVP